jgi:hypothetical protein
MAEIQLPAHGWNPRPYQRALWGYLEDGGKRAACCWHRRAGKDDVALHWSAVSAFERVGTYWHMLPEASQARKAIWEAVDPHTARRRIDIAFPHALRDTTREQEMFIRFKNGSTWQVVGSDNFNSLVGSPPIGLVNSEYSIANPSAWGYLRPILEENGGWSLFIYTPRGRNHGYDLYRAAKDRPDWFAQLLPATDTGVFTAEQLHRIQAEYETEWGVDAGQALFNQEFLCSFDAAIVGAYFAGEFVKIDNEQRITRVMADSAQPVYTGWDLGQDDATAIVFAQVFRTGEWRVLDYYENSGQGPDHYARVLRDKGYDYGAHYMPHDVEQQHFGMNGTRRAMFTQLGLRNIVTIPSPKGAVAERINATRQALRSCVFQAGATDRLTEALRTYRREWDDKGKTWRQTPVHDWTSHPADAFGTLAQGVRVPRMASVSRFPSQSMDWSPYGESREMPRFAVQEGVY